MAGGRGGKMAWVTNQLQRYTTVESMWNYWSLELVKWSLPEAMSPSRISPGSSAPSTCSTTQQSLSGLPLGNI